MERLEASVAIIGAGPAGLVVALRLLQSNVSCVVVERLASNALTARAKAGMIEHRSVEALKPSGLAAPILEQGGTNGLVEFRAHGRGRVFEYAALTGGRGHFVYPQHLLVRAWADRLVAGGGHVRWSCEAMGIEHADDPTRRTTLYVKKSDGQGLAIDCDAVVLASGAGASLIPSGVVSHEHAHPFRWLTTMIEMAPLSRHTVYAPHARGFAAQVPRSPTQARYYLEIPAADALADWDEERIKAELELRLDVVGRGITRSPIVERDLVDLRVRVREPMQQGSVFLAGDAAHLITPAGGKGMNLAIQDALELAEGLIEQQGGSAERLSRYSEVRLPAIWRAQEFSNLMLSLHSGGSLRLGGGLTASSVSFNRKLHAAQLDRLFDDRVFARWFAHNYAGVDYSDPPI
jgi:p-hydroxybenzoate 3-monooxygenase